jgi:phosphate-selective porin OprO and OprP
VSTGAERFAVALLVTLVALSIPPAARTEESGGSAASGSVAYGPDGLVVQSDDGDYRIRIRLRLQFRVVVGPQDDPITPEDFDEPEKLSFLVRRARLKIGGNAVKPWLDYYLEYDIVNTQLLDFRVTLERYPWLKLRLGQWKVEYNRERRDSSGELQLADRSIVNAPFTVDRQQGVMLTGRVLSGKALDSTYFAGVYTGMGAGGGVNDDAYPMWTLRYQWNPFRRELPFEESDIEGRKEAAASLAVATAWNRSPFTAFSSSGGTELPGFAPGVAGQYTVRQWVEEAAVHWRGFSFQHEYHWKRVTDEVAHTVQELRGSYVQAGYIVYRPEPGKPRGLEVAARWAFVDPYASVARDRQHELTGGLNWFFRGHANKITFDVSRLSLEQAGAEDLVSHRARLQWDVHF